MRPLTLFRECVGSCRRLQSILKTWPPGNSLSAVYKVEIEACKVHSVTKGTDGHQRRLTQHHTTMKLVLKSQTEGKGRLK